jgi:hypothetical protein
MPLCKGFDVCIFHFKYLFRILQLHLPKYLNYLFLGTFYLSSAIKKKAGRWWRLRDLKRGTAVDRFLLFPVGISPGA